jgi:hypothetical protein
MGGLFWVSPQQFFNKKLSSFQAQTNRQTKKQTRNKKPTEEITKT